MYIYMRVLRKVCYSKEVKELTLGTLESLMSQSARRVLPPLEYANALIAGDPGSLLQHIARIYHKKVTHILDNSV